MINDEWGIMKFDEYNSVRMKRDFEVGVKKDK